MIQIIALAKGISINGVNYPNNSLTFSKVQPAKLTNTSSTDEVEIRDTRRRVLYRAPYTEYMKSDSTLYASADAVITALQGTYS